jgi:hypothetical protein
MPGAADELPNGPHGERGRFDPQMGFVALDRHHGDGHHSINHTIFSQIRGVKTNIAVPPC